MECSAVSNIDDEMFFVKMPNFHHRHCFVKENRRTYLTVFIKLTKLAELLS